MPSDLVERARGVLSRHPIVTVFIVALAVRAVLAVIVYVTSGGTLFEDDLTYTRLASAVADSAVQHWDQYTEFLYRGTSTFTYPLTWLYQLFGPRAIVGQLFVAVAGAGTAAAVTGLARLMMSAAWAALTGLIVALLPSQILWSSLILKDPLVWLILATIALLVAVANQRSDRNLWLVLGAIALLMLGMGRLREQSLVVAAWALVVAAFFGTADVRRQRVFACLLIALVVPWVTGLGPFGIDFVRSAGSLDEKRALNAQNADSEFVEDPDDVPDEVPTSPGTGSGDESPGEESPGAEPTANGSSSPGSGEGSPGPAAGPPEEPGGVIVDLKHLPRGLSVMLLEPFPWQPSTSSYYRWAKFEIILWYPLLALALLGLRPAFRCLRLLAFPLFAGAGLLVVYALAEGNLGTAVRHRGEFVWVVALLAGLGATTIFEKHDAARSDE